MSAVDLIPVIAPDLAADPQLSGAIAIADGQIGPLIGGSQRDTLVAYLAAHILTLAKRSASTGAASGEITSLREGGLAMTFSTGGSSGSTTLATTAFGAEFARLSRGYIFAPGTRGSL